MPLLRKLALDKEFTDIPKPIERIIAHTNVIRNTVAHSFYPENKREFKRTGEVNYKGKNIFTLDGLKSFDEDTSKAVAYLSNLVYGAPDYP
jgi:hypothetical protein